MTSEPSPLREQPYKLYVFSDSREPNWTRVRAYALPSDSVLAIERAATAGDASWLTLEVVLSPGDALLVRAIYFGLIEMKHREPRFSDGDAPLPKGLALDLLREAANLAQKHVAENDGELLIELAQRLLDARYVGPHDLTAALTLQKAAFSAGTSAGGYLAALTLFRVISESNDGASKKDVLQQQAVSLLEQSAQQGVLRAHVDLACLCRRNADPERAAGHWARYFKEVVLLENTLPGEEELYLVQALYNQVYTQSPSAEDGKFLRGQGFVLKWAKSHFPAEHAFHEWITANVWSPREVALNKWAVPAAALVGWLLMLTIEPNLYVWGAVGILGGIFLVKEQKKSNI